MTKEDFKQFYRLNKEVLNSEKNKHHELNIVKKNCECADLRKKADEFISSIGDDWIKKIFELRFVKCMTWQQVAVQIGGGNTADSIRKIIERYIVKAREEN